MAAGFQKDWSAEHTAFRRFLKWLDQGVDSGGRKYIEMRRRLVRYFDRKNCLAPDELADETLQRVSRRLSEEGEIRDASPAHYCYIVAKFVFLEYRRSPGRGHVSLETVPDLSDGMASTAAAPAVEEQGVRLNCLENCLQKLPSDHRDLIMEYYRDERRSKIECRRRMAARLGVTMNALTIRACRIREKLEQCVRTCCARSSRIFT
jgi:DNA-directed RNA polymerase specialized sigma24 family protein